MVAHAEEDIDVDGMSVNLDQSDTQPATYNSQELAEREIEIRRQHSRTYATLQPLDKAVHLIELHQYSFVCGRDGSDPMVDYSFDRLGRDTPNIYCTLSKRHFSIERRDSETWLVDLSRNGTYINQELLGNGHEIQLVQGDVISLGHASFFVFMYDEQRETDYPMELRSEYLITNTVLGTGGYGKVILGKLRKNVSRCVAIKIVGIKHVSHRFSRSTCTTKEIMNEVVIMQGIKHPNCVEFIDWIDCPKSAYFILEYVGGGEFFDRITAPRYDNKGIGEEMTKFYSYQMLCAVEYLHSIGITHRDIKLENILLADNKDYTVLKLSDFGLSKTVASAKSMRTYCGTPSYMAPEMIENREETYTPAVDIWSLGVVIFTTIVGYPPFSGDYNDMDMDRQITTGRLVLTRHWKDVSGEAQETIRRMLRVDPGTRLTASDALKREWFDEETKNLVEMVIKEFQERA